jgi:dUTP pyrophosphatase
VSGSVDALPHEPSAACPPVDGVRPTVDVLLTRLDAGLPVPAYARSGDAGADLHSVRDVVLEPGERALIGTGVAIALPPGYAGFVHPRSGLAARCGLSIVNAPGTVDAGYRGEILVCLINLDPRTPVRISRGDRIAQLVVQRVDEVAWHVVDTLDGDNRGGGFGHSGR